MYTKDTYLDNSLEKNTNIQAFQFFVPREILFNIIQFLDDKAIANFKKVCHASQSLIDLYFDSNFNRLISRLLDELSGCKINEFQNEDDNPISKTYELYKALTILKTKKESYYSKILQLINYPDLNTPQAMVTFNIWVKNTLVKYNPNGFLLESFLYAEKLYNIKSNFFSCLNLAYHYSMIMNILTLNSLIVPPDIFFERSYRAVMINGIIKRYNNQASMTILDPQHTFSQLCSQISHLKPSIDKESIEEFFWPIFMDLFKKGLLVENNIILRPMEFPINNDVRLQDVIDRISEALMYISDEFHDLFLLLTQENKEKLARLLLTTNIFDLFTKIASIKLGPEYTDSPHNLLSAFEQSQKSGIIETLPPNFLEEISNFKSKKTDKFSPALNTKLTRLLIAAQVYFTSPEIMNIINQKTNHWILEKFPITFETEIQDLTKKILGKTAVTILNKLSSLILIYPDIKLKSNLNSMWDQCIYTLFPLNQSKIQKYFSILSNALLILSAYTIRDLFKLKIAPSKCILVLSSKYLSDTNVNNFFLKLEKFPVFLNAKILSKNVIEYLLCTSMDVTASVAKVLDCEEVANVKTIAYIFDLFCCERKLSDTSSAFQVINKFNTLEHLGIMLSKKLGEFFCESATKQPWFLMLNGNEILRLNKDILLYLNNQTSLIQGHTVKKLRLLMENESYIPSIDDLRSSTILDQNSQYINNNANAITNVKIHNTYFFQIPKTTPNIIEHTQIHTINNDQMDTEENFMEATDINNEVNTNIATERLTLINRIQSLRSEIKSRMDIYRLESDKPEAKRQKFDSC